MKYNRKDSLHQRAKKEGYRSRAAYKLIELNKRYRFLRSGARVLDLGCWPGGWMQVAAKSVGPSGKVVGIDLAEIEALKENNVHFIHGDASDNDLLEQATEFAGGKFNLIISDMSPKHTGIKEVDQAGTVRVLELALYAASKVLQPGGMLIMKGFPGNDTEVFIKDARKQFSKLQRTVLDSTRKSSKEFYVIGRGFQGVAD